MRTVTRAALLVTSVTFASSCGSSTDAGPQIDHVEIVLTPRRTSYPVADAFQAIAVPYSSKGTWAPSVNPPVFTSLTPGIAQVNPGGQIIALAKGDAIIAVDVDGVTAQLTVPIRGLLHTGYVMDHSQTWLVADTPHVVQLTLGVGDLFGTSGEDTVVLTLEPGVTVRFRPGAGLNFGKDQATGVLRIPPGDPVVMEEDPTVPATARPSWQGLKFYSGRSELRNLTLRHCGQDYPFDQAGACLMGIGGELLIDGVTIRDGRNGVSLSMTLLPGSRNLSVHNTRGYVAAVAAGLVGTFPRGGTFTGNDATEILVRGGRVTDSVSWGGLPLPLLLAGGVQVEGPSNPVLTLPAGFHLRSEPGAGFNFASGGIVAGDVAGAPVVLESSGDGWAGITIEHPAGSALRNVVLQDCGVGQGACLVIGPQGGFESGLLVQDVVIRGSHGVGVVTEPGGRFHAASSNLTITQSATYPLWMFMWTIPSVPSGDYRGNGIDAIRVGAGSIDESVTWRNRGIPYRLLDGFTISSSTVFPTLTLEPGVTIQVGLGQSINVGRGELMAVGTPTDTIRFTSVTPGVAGSWMGINLSGDGTMQLRYVEIADAGWGPVGYYGAILFASDPGGVLRNSTVRRTLSCGLVVSNGNAWTDDYTAPAFGNVFVDIPGPLRCSL